MDTIVVYVEVSVTTVVLLREGTTIAAVPDITTADTKMATMTGATGGRPGPDPSVAIDSSRVEDSDGPIKFCHFERRREDISTGILRRTIGR
jgi:hypothetical protein